MASTDVQRMAGLLVRISSDPLHHETGTQRQEKDLRAFCAYRGWQVDEEHIYREQDTGASRFSKKLRPEFLRCLDDARSGRINAIVIWKTDRSTRRGIRVMGEIIEAAEMGGGIVASATEGIDTSNPAGELIFGVLASIAKAESENTSIRTRRLHQDNAEKGRAPGGPPGFGFTRSGKTLVINELEGPLVREAFQRVIDGDTLRAIGADWARRGVRTGRGRPVSQPTLTNMLRSPRMMGDRVHQVDPKLRKSDRTSAVIATGCWPAIVDAATFAKAQSVLDRRRPPERDPARSYLLTGLLECHLCGKTLNHMVSKQGPRYWCRSCTKTSIIGPPLEAFVRDLVIEAVDSDAVRRAVLDEQSADGTTPLVVEMSRLERKLDDLAADYGDDVLSKDEWRSAREKVVVKITTIKRALSRHQSSSVLVHWAGEGDALRSAWNGLDGAEPLSLKAKRDLIESVLFPIVVGPATRGLHRFEHERLVLRWLKLGAVAA